MNILIPHHIRKRSKSYMERSQSLDALLSFSFNAYIDLNIISITFTPFFIYKHIPEEKRHHKETKN